MKLLSYGLDHRMEPRLAFALRGYAVDIMRAALWMKEQRQAREFLTLPASLDLALRDWSSTQPLIAELIAGFQSLDLAKLRVYERSVALPEAEIAWFAPVPNPPSLRYFQGFQPGSAEFSFGNTQTLLGHQQDLSHLDLTPQVELAALVAVKPDGSEPELAGYCICNNWIDRTINPHNIGLALGQATSLGPYLVTADELAAQQLGSGYQLASQLRRNGTVLAESSFQTLQTSFTAMLELAALTQIQAGDIICSGSPLANTVLEPAQTGDRIEVELQLLGTLTNQVKPPTRA